MMIGHVIQGAIDESTIVNLTEGKHLTERALRFNESTARCFASLNMTLIINESRCAFL